MSAGMSPDQKNIFSTLLADAGYLSIHDGTYRKAYLIRESVLYRIDRGFPMIDATLIPPGVTSVKYSLELAALKPFAAASPIGPIGN